MRRPHTSYREGTLPIAARKVGRLILVSPYTGRCPAGRGGLYVRVSAHDQKVDLDRQTVRLSAWAAQASLPVARVEAVVGSGMNGTKTRPRRRLADPAAIVVDMERRDGSAR